MPLTARDNQRLATCDPRLVRLVEYVARFWPCMVLEGHRDQLHQDAAHAAGKSQLKWPHGKHNSYPSTAVDLAPLPLDWNDTERFLAFADFVTGAAHRLRVPLRWGGDWDGDPATPNRFQDLVHHEIAG
ncbi:MAG: M15 family peptidase [Candidatus Binatia bacterium]